MSKGLGRIERAILASIASSKQMAKSGVLIDDESSVHITAWKLAYECFEPRPDKPGWTPSRSQIKVCIRAMHSIARKFPQYALIPGRGPKAIVLYELDDPVSVLRAKMRIGTEN